MRKIYLAMCLFVAFACTALAQEKMIVEKTDGSKIECNVTDISKVYFSMPSIGEMVDLGLPSGIKWASCNVGASKPEEYGGYYAWGETEEKSEYTPATYQHWVDKDGDGEFDENEGTITTDISGTEYDVAHVKWGGTWRMPTYEEINELIDNCTWEWTTVNGVNGQKVTGPNGNSIFLPAAGYHDSRSLSGVGDLGSCWSSTPYGSYSDGAYILDFGSGGSDWGIGWRCSGLSVRPVSE